MTILVDTDACPFKDEIVAEARRARVSVLFVMADAHITTLPDDCDVVSVSGGPDAADFALLSRTTVGDIVITDDYPLAGLALARGAYPLTFRGLPITQRNIDRLVMRRHVARKMRKAGRRIRGPRALRESDRTRFANALRTTIENALANAAP